VTGGNEPGGGVGGRSEPGDAIGRGVGVRGLGGTGGAVVAKDAGAAAGGSGGGSGRAGRGSGGGAFAADATACRAAATADLISPAEANRFSRSFSRARFTKETMAEGTSAAQRRTGGGWRWTTWKRTLGVESASNGLCPVSSSYSTAPVEKRSERPSTLSPRACSGDM
jgi:hypothetical protein